jgi:hypothetical protein
MPRRRADNCQNDSMMKHKMLIANDANGSGGSAVVIASRDAKDVMRKL